MNRKELADLLSRALAALEDPHALSPNEYKELEEDLATAERELRPES